MAYTLTSETVEFSDGTSLVVHEATWLEDAQLVELEDKAAEINQAEIEKAKDEGRELTVTEKKVQFFRHDIYPKIAAPSSGDVPTEEEARLMPASQLNKWYAAARRVNPDWFTVFDLARTKADELKKREKSSAK